MCGAGWQKVESLSTSKHSKHKIEFKSSFADKQSCCSHVHTWDALSRPDITDRADNITNNGGSSSVSSQV